MGVEEEMLIERVMELYDNISRLESLSPSKDVNMLFTELVLTCMPPSPVDVSKLSRRQQEKRLKLIKLCGEAEGLMEAHFSSILASFPRPLDHVDIFPYYDNYLKLSLLEHDILAGHYSAPTHVQKVAFVGSGPLPLSSIVLAKLHLKSAVFYNYDVDPAANAAALRLVAADQELAGRMVFHTVNIMDVTHSLQDYDVVFLAALVGMQKEEKTRVVKHLAKYMAPGGILMLRSAHGARAFLYPVIELADLRGFEILSVFHPTDEVINSVILARKCENPVHAMDQGLGSIILPCKCSEIQAFNPLNRGAMVEELTVEEKPAY